LLPLPGKAFFHLGAEALAGQLHSLQGDPVRVKDDRRAAALHVNWAAGIAAPAKVRHQRVGVFLAFAERLEVRQGLFEP